MTIKYTCTSCSKTLALKDEFAGKKIKCPACKTVLSVPAAPVAASAPVKTTPAVKQVVQKCTAKCDDCNSSFSDVSWKEGMPCIGCGSTNFFPSLEEKEDGAEKGKTKSKKIKPLKASSGGGWKKSPIVAGILLVLILSVWAKPLYTSMFGSDLPAIDMMCQACNKEFRAPRPKSVYPWVCFDCQEAALYKAVKCDNGHHFPQVIPTSLYENAYPCPICSKPMVYAEATSYEEMLICSEQLDFTNKTPCKGKQVVQTFYCADKLHTWNVFPGAKENGKVLDACPVCSSKDIHQLHEFRQQCPECKSTKISSITPYKKK